MLKWTFLKNSYLSYSNIATTKWQDESHAFKIINIVSSTLLKEFSPNS